MSKIIIILCMCLPNILEYLHDFSCAIVSPLWAQLFPSDIPLINFCWPSYLHIIQHKLLHQLRLNVHWFPLLPGTLRHQCVIAESLSLKILFAIACSSPGLWCKPFTIKSLRFPISSLVNALTSIYNNFANLFNNWMGIFD